MTPLPRCPHCKGKPEDCITDNRGLCNKRKKGK